MLALVITEAGKTFPRKIAMIAMIVTLALRARVGATMDDTILQAVAISRHRRGEQQQFIIADQVFRLTKVDCSWPWNWSGKAHRTGHGMLVMVQTVNVHKLLQRGSCNC